MITIKLPNRGLLFRFANAAVAVSALIAAATAVLGLLALKDSFAYVNTTVIEPGQLLNSRLSISPVVDRFRAQLLRPSNSLVYASERIYDPQGKTILAACSQQPTAISGLEPLSKQAGLPQGCRGFTAGKVLLPSQVLNVDGKDRIAFLSGDLKVVDVSTPVHIIQSVYVDLPFVLIGIVIALLGVSALETIFASSPGRLILAASLAVVSASLGWNYPFAGTASLILFPVLVLVATVLAAGTVYGTAGPFIEGWKQDQGWIAAVDSHWTLAWLNIPLYFATAAAIVVVLPILFLLAWISVFQFLAFLISLLFPAWIGKVLELSIASPFW